jgi:hypothetical protein
MLHAVTSEAKWKASGVNSLPAVAEGFGAPVVRRSPFSALQSAYGNQAVLRFLTSSSKSQIAGGSANGVLQRKCACAGGGEGECAECKKKEESVLQRSASARARAGAGVPPIVHEVLRSPGQPLDRGTREFMESRFGHDFGGVRAHTDTTAARSARAVDALAYTVGNDVVFAHGRYQPATSEGRRLVAHELAHVIQQGSVVQPSRSSLTISAEDSALERQADHAADSALRSDGGPITFHGASSSLQREADDEDGGGIDQGGQADQTDATTSSDESSDYRELSDEEAASIVIFGQAATTPDGNSLGPTDRAHRGCLGNNFFFSGGVAANSTTAARVHSVVTAHLGQPPKDAANCSCGCGLFRQFIRGFFRLGSPTSAKQFNIVSCGNPLTLSENSFTEEFVNCITAGVPIGPGCSRTQNDFPGAAGISEGTFVQVHLVLRYQMWDQCRGQSLGVADHVLDIKGSRSPRTITFT